MLFDFETENILKTVLFTAQQNINNGVLIPVH